MAGSPIKIPVELQNEIVGDNVVLFIGAGFVKNYMPDMPTWDELLISVFERLTGKKDGIFDYCSAVYNDKGKRILPPGEYLRVAQQFELARESINIERAAKSLPIIPSIHRLIQDEISTSYTKESAVRAAKDKELLALRTLPFGAWVTTNYDTFVEDILFENSSNPSQIISRPVRNIDFRPHSGGRFLLKIHGTINAVDPESSIVITEDDYHKFIRQDRYLINKLYTLFCERTVIFLGYALSDPNIQFIYNEVLFDQKRSSGEKILSFSQIRPTYFVNRQPVAQEDKTYYSHKRINYLEECEIEDFFSAVSLIFKSFQKSQMVVEKRVGEDRAKYDSYFKELNERTEDDLSRNVAPENRARFMSVVYDFVELHTLHYASSPSNSDAFRPYDNNLLVGAIHKGARVCETWIEEQLKQEKIDLFQQHFKFTFDKLRTSNGWLARHWVQRIGLWLIRFEKLHDRDKLAQDFIMLLLEYDDSFNTWDDYKFCLEQYILATNLFPVLGDPTKKRLAARLYRHLSRCGRRPGESWYSTDLVYEVWNKLNPTAWPYLEKVIRSKEMAGPGGTKLLPDKDQAMLDHLGPGGNPNNFLPRS